MPCAPSLRRFAGASLPWLRCAAALCLAALLALPAAAAPATYIFTGNAVGTLDGQAFSGALTVTAAGDTGDVAQNGSTFSNLDVTAIIAIAGLGSFEVTGPDYVFDNQNAEKIGYGVSGRPPAVCCDIIQHENPAYATYDLLSSIGPIPFGGNLSIASWVDVPTTGGLLTVTSYLDTAFEAVVGVPEPGALAMLACGLLGLAARRGRTARAPALTRAAARRGSSWR